MLKPSNIKASILIFLCIVVFAVVLLRNAWVCDDAYISFRCIDNLLNGYDLTYNVAERVQAFTHPLWVLILIPSIAIGGHAYFTVLTISVLLSLGTVILFAFKFNRSTMATCIGLVALSLSDAFIDYSTSGLENPLTYFLFIIFVYFFLEKKLNLRNFLFLSILAGLAVFNRMDTILFYMPALGYAFWKTRNRTTVAYLMIGFVPFMLWEIFSMWYYGMPFPNTAYAKLNTGINGFELAGRGFLYLYNSLQVDPLTIIVIACGILLPFVFKDKRGILISLGIILTLIYIVSIGGCFMSGRHLAAPFLAALILALRNLKTDRRTVMAGMGVIVLILGLGRPYSPVYTRAGVSYDPERDDLPDYIVDERTWYQYTNGLINYNGNPDKWPDNVWANAGRDLRADTVTRQVTFLGVIGMVGYYAGPKLHTVDAFALADPLLARLPVVAELEFKIGHFRRHLPPGYYQSIEAGENLIDDEFLAPYYDKLLILTRGDLCSIKRLTEIIKFNLGLYDHYLEDYLKPHLLKIKLATFGRLKGPKTLWWVPTNIILSGEGAEILLNKKHHSRTMEVSTEGDDDFRFLFLNNGEKIADLLFTKVRSAANDLDVYTAPVPLKAVETGYDAIRVLPLPGDARYVIGHLRLLD